MNKYLKHLVFWPGCLLITLGCFGLLPLSFSVWQYLGFLCIWTGITGFLGLCPIPMTQDYTGDFRRGPYLLYIPIGIIQIIFQFGFYAFLILNALVTAAIRLFDHT